MVWDLETGKEIHRFEGHGDRVMCVQFDERKIGTSYIYPPFPPASIICFFSECLTLYYYAVSGSVDKLVKIWDLRAEGACHTLAGHEYTVYHLAFDDYKIGMKLFPILRLLINSTSYPFVVSASKDRTVITWDFTTETPLEKRKGSDIIHSFDTSTHHISANGSIVKNWSVAIPSMVTPASAASSGPSGSPSERGVYDYCPSGNVGPSTVPSTGVQPMDYPSFLGRLYPGPIRPVLSTGLTGGNTNNSSSTNNNNANTNNNDSPQDNPTTPALVGHFPAPLGSSNAGPNIPALENLRRRRDRKIPVPLFAAFGGPGRALGRGTSGGRQGQDRTGGGVMGTGGMLGMRDRLRHFGYTGPSTFASGGLNASQPPSSSAVPPSTSLPDPTGGPSSGFIPLPPPFATYGSEGLFPFNPNQSTFPSLPTPAPTATSNKEEEGNAEPANVSEESSPPDEHNTNSREDAMEQEEESKDSAETQEGL